MALSTSERTVVSAATESDAFNAGSYTSGSVQLPTGFTGTNLQPQFSNDNTNWTNVGSVMTVAAEGTYSIPDAVFNAKYGRFVVDTQAADRTLILGLRT